MPHAPLPPKATRLSEMMLARISSFTPSSRLPVLLSHLIYQLIAE